MEKIKGERRDHTREKKGRIRGKKGRERCTEKVEHMGEMESGIEEEGGEEEKCGETGGRWEWK